MQPFAVNTVDNVLYVAKETTNSRTTSPRLSESKHYAQTPLKREEEHGDETRRLTAPEVFHQVSAVGCCMRPWETLSVERSSSACLNYGQVREL